MAALPTVDRVMAVPLTLLLAALAAAAPATPADRANIGLRKQVAAPSSVLRTTDAPAETTQALVCSQIFGVLPFTTFRRQRFDSFTTCQCVSDKTAVCAPDTFYPTVMPGTPEAALSQEHSGFNSDRFIEVLNAFSVQQTCFFEHLRGQKLSPPRPCAFSWQRASRPACDCAQPEDTPTEAGSSVEATSEEPAPTPVDVETSAETASSAVEEAEPESSAEQAAVTSTAAPATPSSVTPPSDEMTTKAAALPPDAERVDLSEVGLEKSAALLDGEQRRPQVAEAFHLRRVRSARRH